MVRIKFIIALLGLIVLLSGPGCTRNTIEFGTVPENGYTHLVYIDSVGIKMSTVVTDSFATGGASSFLLGKYKDPYLGVIKAKPFFQLNKPADITDIPVGAIYDSLTLIIKLNDYYYGDTTNVQTIYVNELAQTIVTGYDDKLYNNSNVPVKPAALGTKTIRIRPVTDDSIIIRLDDSKGMELFTKLQQQSTDVTVSANFLNYFKGISLSTNERDTAAVIGVQASTGIVMRVNYHTNTPFNETHFIDFPSISNSLAFNQILADRSGTGLVAGIGVTELPSSATGSNSFSQPGTGLDLKIIFPSLKGILLTSDYVKLLKAELILRPAEFSFDRNKYKLPERLLLAYTNATNLNNGLLSDSTGRGTLYATPVIDDIYGQNTYYRFNVTAYINQLLLSPGTEKYGLYVTPEFSTTQPHVNRFVMGGTGHSAYTTQLRLSFLTVNK
ncbi:MAG: DUF4270 family protein [Chitinophagaceae bacterium]